MLQCIRVIIISGSVWHYFYIVRIAFCSFKAEVCFRRLLLKCSAFFSGGGWLKAEQFTNHIFSFSIIAFTNMDLTNNSLPINQIMGGPGVVMIVSPGGIIVI